MFKATGKVALNILERVGFEGKLPQAVPEKLTWMSASGSFPGLEVEHRMCSTVRESQTTNPCSPFFMFKATGKVALNILERVGFEGKLPQAVPEKLTWMSASGSFPGLEVEHRMCSTVRESQTTNPCSPFFIFSGQKGDRDVAVRKFGRLAATRQDLLQRRGSPFWHLTVLQSGGPVG